MFRGDHPELDRTFGRAVLRAREFGHPRVGSEHLMLALTDGPLADLDGIERAVHLAAPDGAGAAADRDVLAVLDIDLGPLLGTLLDRRPAKEPLSPWVRNERADGGPGCRRRSAWTPKVPTRHRCGSHSLAGSVNIASSISL